MLILSRATGEKIIIGKEGDVLDGPITICNLDVRGGRVRIGIDCQRDISVHRSEVQDRVDVENEGRNE